MSQVQRRIGPAWSGRGRPPAGQFTKRTAEAWLRDVLDQARTGTLPGLVRTGVTFAEAADEWLRYVEHDRERKPSTVAGYRALVRSQLLPTFGGQAIESITTPMIERWLAGVDRASSTRTKSLVLMHGIFQRARKLYGLRFNPVANVEKPSLGRSGNIEVFSPEEVMTLVRAAASRQDAAIFLLVESKQSRARDDRELFATYLQIAGESRDVITEHVNALVAQLARIVGDGVEQEVFVAPDASAAGRAVFDATARFHNPANAASWSDPGIATAYEQVVSLILAGLSAPAKRATGRG